jgi:peptidoglycan/LPS O-acetylase OafA/YrhL
MMQYCGFFLAWWFNVGVQIFFCISGYLYGQKRSVSVLVFYKKRFNKILKPYWIAVLIFGAVEVVFFRSEFSLKHFIEALVCRTTISGGEHLWFIPVILMCYVITPLLNAIRDDTGKNRIWFIVGTVVITTVFFGLFASYFNPAWMSCYVLGYWIGTNKNEHFISENVLIVIFGILAIPLNFLQAYFSYLLKPGFVSSGIYSYWCNYNHVWLGIFIFLVLMKETSKISWDGKSIKKLDLADKYSYETYLVHQFFILGPMSLMAVTRWLPVNIIIIYGCILAAAFALKQFERTFAMRKRAVE